MIDQEIDEAGYHALKEQAQHYHQTYLDIINDSNFEGTKATIYELLDSLRVTAKYNHLYRPGIVFEHE